MVAVGLFYRFGYMGQRVDGDGEQIMVDRENLPCDLPLEVVPDENGEPLEISIELPDRELFLRAWRVQVGRPNVDWLRQLWARLQPRTMPRWTT